MVEITKENIEKKLKELTTNNIIIVKYDNKTQLTFKILDENTMGCITKGAKCITSIEDINIYLKFGRQVFVK